MLADITHEYFERINENITNPEDLTLFLFLVGIALGNTLNRNLKEDATERQVNEILELVSNSAVVTFNEKKNS